MSLRGECVARPHYLHVGYFEAGGGELVQVHGSGVLAEIQEASRARLENISEALSLNNGEIFASEISF